MVAFTSTSLITGGTTGLGYWAAFEIARQSPTTKVIISSRSDREDAVKSLNALLSKERSRSKKSNNDNEKTDTPQVSFMPLDLSSNTKVRTFVTEYTKQNNPPISSLVLNAGAQWTNGNDISYSTDGVELTFATNHVGHALLFFLLRPHLANDARIVLTASGLHDPEQIVNSRIPMPAAKFETADLLAHPTDGEGYGVNNRGLQRYASSKLANVLFMYALERRFADLRKVNPTSTGAKGDAKNWTVAAMDPGLMPGTSLGRDNGPVIAWIFMHVMPHCLGLLKWLIKSDNVHLPQESGASLAALAVADGEMAVNKMTGRYFEGSVEKRSGVESRDQDRQEDLWRWTVEELGVNW